MNMNTDMYKIHNLYSTLYPVSIVLSKAVITYYVYIQDKLLVVASFYLNNFILFRLVWSVSAAFYELQNFMIIILVRNV